MIQPCPELHGQKITVPGDISSAAYFIAAGLLVPDSEILVKNVGINPTRAGLLKVCEDMGGNITLLNERTEAGEKWPTFWFAAASFMEFRFTVISFPH